MMMIAIDYTEAVEGNAMLVGMTAVEASAFLLTAVLHPKSLDATGYPYQQSYELKV
jgi:hypothetical protein